MSTRLKVTVKRTGEEKVFEISWVSTEAALNALKEERGMEWGTFGEGETVQVELIEE